MNEPEDSGTGLGASLSMGMIWYARSHMSDESPHTKRAARRASAGVNTHNQYNSIKLSLSVSGIAEGRCAVCFVPALSCGCRRSTQSCVLLTWLEGFATCISSSRNITSRTTTTGA